jgi:succinate dehydrogenase/fumarate reductase flavoprotein subunit
MTKWHDYLMEQGHAPDWPYPIQYDKEQEIDADVLIIGGGIAGCWAAISAARQGLNVAMAEKADTIRSGAGGPGCDHWCNAPANPLSNVDPDEWAVHMADRPYCNGIGIQIQCREDWDTLQELEQMGAKIRDTGDDYVGAIGRDEKTKIMISPRYTKLHNYYPIGLKHVVLKSNPDQKLNNVVIRVWGTTFKPALKKECQRLGVKIFDRVMMTSLLTENGVQGGRVIGATGFNDRTGEFMIFKSKATILSTSGGGSVWVISTELGGYCNMTSRSITGDGTVMAWKAGATLTSMDTNGVMNIGGGHKHKWYSGAGDASYENVPIVDANGKRVPMGIQGWEDAGAMSQEPGSDARIREEIMKGKYALPFYGDFPSMQDAERRATWKLMLGEESTVKIITDTFNQAGYDPSRDLLQSYKFIEGNAPPQFREAGYGFGGGVLVDWDLKTTLDGLYAAGMQMFAPEDHSYAAATGRYAGRKAAAYAKQIGDSQISREQVDREKARVYAPVNRNSGMDWKELHAGVGRVMQYYCSEYKTDNLLNMGLTALQKIEEESVPLLHATDPHKLMRCLEDVSLLIYGRIIVQASLARKASSVPLNFQRIDYPAVDPPEWDKYITLRQEDGQVRTGELPQAFWGNMKEQYEARNKDYTGVYKGK